MHPTPSNGWFAESSLGPDVYALRTRRRFPRRCRGRGMARGLRRKRTGKTHVFGRLPLCPCDGSACGAHAAPAQVSLAVSLRREFVLGRTRAGSSLKGVSRLAAPPCLWANLVRSKSSQGDRMNGIVEKRPTIGGGRRRAPRVRSLPFGRARRFETGSRGRGGQRQMPNARPDDVSKQHGLAAGDHAVRESMVPG